MRTLLTLAILVAGAVGCGDNGGSMSMDLAQAKDMALPPATDGGGTKMYGDQCFVAGQPGDCAPGLVCDMFVMNTILRCTRICSPNPCDATCCPAPSSGTCNAKGECRLTQ